MLELTINVDLQEDSSDSKVDHIQFKQLFGDEDLSGGAQARFEVFNYLQNYLYSACRWSCRETLWVHSDILELDRKKIEELIFKTIGGDVHPSDWHNVMITDTKQLLILMTQLMLKPLKTPIRSRRACWRTSSSTATR